MDTLKNYKSIGEELYYKSEQDMRNLREWYDSNESESDSVFCFAEDGKSKYSLKLRKVIDDKDCFDEGDFFRKYYSNYCECIYRWIRSKSASFDDVMEYNKLWWDQSKCSINVFTPYYTKDMIIKENPYNDFYKKLNQYVMCVSSQMYLKTELSPWHFPHFVFKRLEGVLFQTVQRPYVKIICKSKDAEKLCEIDDDNLLIGHITESENKWKFNSTYKKYCDPCDELWVTKRFFPSVYDVDNVTHVYYGTSNYAVDVDDYMIKCNMYHVDDYDDLAYVFVVYRHWDNNVDLDPMEYMFGRVIECLKN